MAELEKKATTAATTVAVAAELEVLFWYTTGFTRVDLESFTYPSGVYYERDFYASLVRKSVLHASRAFRKQIMEG